MLASSAGPWPAAELKLDHEYAGEARLRRRSPPTWWPAAELELDQEHAGELGAPATAADLAPRLVDRGGDRGDRGVELAAGQGPSRVDHGGGGEFDRRQHNAAGDRGGGDRDRGGRRASRAAAPDQPHTIAAIGSHAATVSHSGASMLARIATRPASPRALQAPPRVRRCAPRGLRTPRKPTSGTSAWMRTDEASTGCVRVVGASQQGSDPRRAVPVRRPRRGRRSPAAACRRARRAMTAGVLQVRISSPVAGRRPSAAFGRSTGRSSTFDPDQLLDEPAVRGLDDRHLRARLDREARQSAAAPPGSRCARELEAQGCGKISSTTLWSSARSTESRDSTEL